MDIWNAIIIGKNKNKKIKLNSILINLFYLIKIINN